MASSTPWLCTLSAVSLLLFSSINAESFPSSCIGKEDGKYWLKLMDGDSFPVVHQQCSNEYMIIDLYEDPEVAKMFSSMEQWHYAIAGW